MTNLNNILFDDKKYITATLLEFDHPKRRNVTWQWRLAGRLECALQVVNVIQNHTYDSKKEQYLIYLKRLALEYLST